VASPSSDPREPRYRPFRVAAYLLYIAVVTVVSSLVIYSVLRSVIAMSPKPPRSSPATLSVSECVSGASRLWEELDNRRKGFTEHHPARRVDELWMAFRGPWVQRLRELEGMCGTGTGARPQLRAIFAALENVQDLYTTHAVQYAGEVGSAVDRLVSALEAARAAEN
jgi:hypothetical protein